jgi:pyruvate ferredoxin oxidoreductase beta subunit
MAQSVIKFYQTGTFTVGNRLLPEEDRALQSDAQRANSLTSGHRACQGCGEALGARYAIDAAMRGAQGKLIVAIPWIFTLAGGNRLN